MLRLWISSPVLFSSSLARRCFFPRAGAARSCPPRLFLAAPLPVSSCSARRPAYGRPGRRPPVLASSRPSSSVCPPRPPPGGASAGAVLPRPRFACSHCPPLSPSLFGAPQLPSRHTVRPPRAAGPAPRLRLRTGPGRRVAPSGPLGLPRPAARFVPLGFFPVPAPWPLWLWALPSVCSRPPPVFSRSRPSRLRPQLSRPRHVPLPRPPSAARLPGSLSTTPRTDGGPARGFVKPCGCLRFAGCPFLVRAALAQPGLPGAGDPADGRSPRTSAGPLPLLPGLPLPPADHPPVLRCRPRAPAGHRSPVLPNPHAARLPAALVLTTV